MEKLKYQFEDFLMTVSDDYKDFVITVHEMLLRDNYKIKIESKKNGFLVSYSHPKTKRVIMNFLFRKKGLLIRVYAENCAKYPDVLNSLPERIVDQIAGATVCKKLVNPQDCWEKCVMGYDFYIGGNHYQKCRYDCFQLDVDSESIPFLLELIESENKERRTA